MCAYVYIHIEYMYVYIYICVYMYMHMYMYTYMCRGYFWVTESSSEAYNIRRTTPRRPENEVT